MCGEIKCWSLRQEPSPPGHRVLWIQTPRTTKPLGSLPSGWVKQFAAKMASQQVESLAKKKAMPKTALSLGSISDTEIGPKRKGWIGIGAYSHIHPEPYQI